MSNETNVKAGDPRNPSVIGRVSVWFKKTGETRFKEFGNIINPAIAVEIERLAHFSTRRGTRAKDREEISSRSAKLNFEIDELNKSNLQYMFGSKEAAAVDTLDLSEGKILTNPASGASVEVGDVSIKNLVITSISEEAPEVTYAAEPFTTDSTDDTAGGTFNNTTDPITIVAATYPGTTFVVGTLIKVESEYLRAESVGGGNVVLSRGALGSTPVAHANAVSIYKSGGGDYVANLTTGEIYVLPGGDLEDDGDVAEFHAQYEIAVDTESFEGFTGDEILGILKFQCLTPGGPQWAAFANKAIVKSNGDISLGDGTDWTKLALTVEMLEDSNGKLVQIHMIKEGELS